MIGTVLLQTVSNGTVVAFAEGDLGSATWTPQISLVVDEGYAPLALSNITAKTVSGFTVTGLLTEPAQIFGFVSDGGVIDDEYAGLAANAIATLNEVKAYLKQPIADTTDDAFLRATINRVSDEIEGIVGGKVRLQSITGLILDGTGSDKLYLPAQARPIVQIGTSTTADEPDIQYRTTLIAAWTDLFASGDIVNAILNPTEPYYICLYNESFPPGWQNIKLNCKAGYSTIPGVISKVCIEAVVESYKESGRMGSRLGIQSMSGGVDALSGNITFKGLSEKHSDQLMRYKFYG